MKRNDVLKILEDEGIEDIELFSQSDVDRIVQGRLKKEKATIEELEKKNSEMMIQSKAKSAGVPDYLLKYANTEDDINNIVAGISKNNDDIKKRNISPSFYKHKEENKQEILGRILRGGDEDDD